MMQRYLAGLAAVFVVGCASTSANLASNFGPTTKLSPGVQSANLGRDGIVTVRVNLPQPEYLAAVAVFPNQSVLPLGASDRPSGTKELAAGAQAVVLRQLPALHHSAPDWTLADIERCNANPHYPRCQQQGYVVIVASENPFDTREIVDNITAVDLHGSDADVIRRIGEAAAHATGAAWSATAMSMTGMVAPY
jgi:hypothetical protein